MKFIESHGLHLFSFAPAGLYIIIIIGMCMVLNQKLRLISALFQCGNNNSSGDVSLFLVFLLL